MTPSKLTAMALSTHPRYVDPRRLSNGLLRATVTVFRALLRQYRKARLLQEKAALWQSFQRVAAEIGVPPGSPGATTTEGQKAKLARIRQIEQQLRELRNTTQTT